MTALLDKALAKVGRLPRARQDELARMLLIAAGSDNDSISLAPEQVAEVEKRLLEAEDTLSVGEVKAEVARWVK